MHVNATLDPLPLRHRILLGHVPPRGLHHKELFGTPGAGQDENVFRFATDVNVDQSTEIARMNQMLAEMQP